MPEDCRVEIVLSITCGKPLHTHRYAHTACGNDEGIHWALTWWNMSATEDDPDGPANEDHRVTVNRIPVPREPLRKTVTEVSG